MSLFDALAPFTEPGAITSEAKLGTAISNLFDALDSAEDDIVSLLLSLANTSSGVFETVMTSRT